MIIIHFLKKTTKTHRHLLKVRKMRIKGFLYFKHYCLMNEKASVYVHKRSQKTVSLVWPFGGRKASALGN